MLRRNIRGHEDQHMRLDKIAIGHNPPYDVNVIVEVSVGSDPVKYELDKESGALFVDRFLHTAMHYPVNYGFIPHTLSEDRSEEHTSELQSLMRISYAVFCLKQKKK